MKRLEKLNNILNKLDPEDKEFIRSLIFTDDIEEIKARANKLIKLMHEAGGQDMILQTIHFHMSQLGKTILNEIKNYEQWRKDYV